MFTPDIPQLLHVLGPLGRGVRAVRQSTPSELERLFGALLPAALLGQAPKGPNSRERVFTLRRTFWLFLSQVLTPNSSCRMMVRELQARLDTRIQSGSNGYVQARARLPLRSLRRLLRASALAAESRCTGNEAGRLGGRPVRVVDATSTQLPDTAPNQERYPQPPGQRPGCGFPVLKVLALFSLSSGAVLEVACASLKWGDGRLFRRTWKHLRPGDIVLADRAFADYRSLAQLPARQVDLVARLSEIRKVDFREPHKHLGQADALFRWTKPDSIRHMTDGEWERLPEEITVRVLEMQVQEPGFRSRKIRLVTTLLDPVKHPAAELLALYRRRWRLELCFRDLKTSLGMERLSCQSPLMAHKELRMYLIAHNLIRCLMGRAAGRHGVEFARTSFKGSVDAVRKFGPRIAAAGSLRKRGELEDRLLEILAEDLVPDRPGRREPRAKKRRHKSYPYLTEHRRTYKDIPHRNVYYRKPAKKPTAP